MLRIQKALRVSQSHGSNDQNFLRLDTKTEYLPSNTHPAQEFPDFFVHVLPGTGRSLLYKAAAASREGCTVKKSFLRLKLNPSPTEHWATFSLLELDCIILILWVLPEQNFHNSSIKIYFPEQTQVVKYSFDSGVCRVL